MTAPSLEIIRQVREEYGPRTILAFSTGKDAISAWLAMRDHFDEIVPYFCYLVPGLEFVDEAVDYYERFFGVHIYKMPHPSLYRWLNEGLYMTPAQLVVVKAADLPVFTFADTVRAVAKIAGIEKPMAADGVRAADSPLRRVGFLRHGAIRRDKGRYCPVWDLSKQNVIDLINRAGISLPIDYLLFGRTFDGLDLRFMVPLRDHRPADYRRVLEWFPLVEAAVWRYDRGLA